MVVLGLGKPTPNSFDVLKELAQDPQSPRVVICSEETHGVIVTAARHCGALAYVFKDRIEEDLIVAIQWAQQGRFFVSSVTGGTEQYAKFFKELGRRVRELREKAGYTQANMESFGFSVRHWQQVESGRPVTMTTLLRVCQVFKIKLDDLVQGLGGDIFHD